MIDQDILILEAVDVENPEPLTARQWKQVWLPQSM